MRFLLDDPIYCRAGYLDVGEKKRKEGWVLLSGIFCITGSKSCNVNSKNLSICRVWFCFWYVLGEIFWISDVNIDG